ncbi:MAG TPA: tripartite tricarboxylate transporter substrate-binding protein, partial [Burkholderiales bacterium]|nr:tripartite tricarboxylate transporter substrate-binding protein [Burkholderiales bacterium]
VFAVTARKRSPSLPDVPTVEEAGLPGYETVQWLGPAAPAGTPRAVVNRLHAEFTKALRNPKVAERLSAAGLEVAPSASPEAYAEFIRAEHARWPAIVKAAGVTPE